MFSHCWLVQFALKLTWQVQENSIMFILIYLERKSFALLLSYFSQKSSIGIMYCVRIAWVFCILCEVICYSVCSVGLGDLFACNWRLSFTVWYTVTYCGTYRVPYKTYRIYRIPYKSIRYSALPTMQLLCLGCYRSTLVRLSSIRFDSVRCRVNPLDDYETMTMTYPTRMSHIECSHCSAGRRAAMLWL